MLMSSFFRFNYDEIIFLLLVVDCWLVKDESLFWDISSIFEGRFWFSWDNYIFRSVFWLSFFLSCIFSCLSYYIYSKQDKFSSLSLLIALEYFSSWLPLPDVIKLVLFSDSLFVVLSWLIWISCYGLILVYGNDLSVKTMVLNDSAMLNPCNCFSGGEVTLIFS